MSWTKPPSNLCGYKTGWCRHDQNVVLARPGDPLEIDAPYTNNESEEEPQ